MQRRDDVNEQEYGDEGPEWWKDAVVYQLYPRSFADSNGDGIGDLEGIVSRVEYLEWLGVDAVWLNPIYASPDWDYGYDIEDYYSIDPQYGTMEQFEELRDALHRRGIRLVMDLVVNHTSDRHRWFRESVTDPKGPYSDFYIWRPPRNGGMPNNWNSFFGGPAWSYVEERGEYYLHLFSPHQPDLNWDNPKVREEIYEIIRWWSERGIDGFRMDVINMISKAADLPDDTRELDPLAVRGTVFFEHGPRLDEYLQELRSRALGGRDLFLLGECPGAHMDDVLSLSGYERRELDAVFHMELMEIDHGEGGKWDIRPWRPENFAALVERWQRGLEGRAWRANFFSNHDQPRALSRFGNDREYRRESAKMLATVLLTLTGTPFIYYGEEIGMTNAAYESIDKYRDVDTLNFYRIEVENGMDPEEIMRKVRYMSRDNARSPMQWSAEEGAGFSDAQPWIPLSPRFREINVKDETAAEGSIFTYYRELIELRRKAPALRRGTFQRLKAGDARIFAYLKSRGGEQYLVLANLSGEAADARIPDTEAEAQSGGWESLVIGTYPDAVPPARREHCTLRPYEALVCRRTDRSGEST
jgi:oligo-1,6-glucosidase